MQALPIAMLNTAANAEGSPEAIKLEALRYAAANADIGMDIFRTHYLPLLSGKTQFDARIVEAAIWGGMVRSDPMHAAPSLSPYPTPHRPNIARNCCALLR